MGLVCAHSRPNPGSDSGAVAATPALVDCTAAANKTHTKAQGSALFGGGQLMPRTKLIETAVTGECKGARSAAAARPLPPAPWAAPNGRRRTSWARPRSPGAKRRGFQGAARSLTAPPEARRSALLFFTRSMHALPAQGLPLQRLLPRPLQERCSLRQPHGAADSCLKRWLGLAGAARLRRHGAPLACHLPGLAWAGAGRGSVRMVQWASA